MLSNPIPDPRQTGVRFLARLLLLYVSEAHILLTYRFTGGYIVTRHTTSSKLCQGILNVFLYINRFKIVSD